MIESYRDLIVWQKSIQLCLAIYKLTAKFPQNETYGLMSQLRRAGVSIPSNIAEGYGRSSTGEYKHFLGVARGSNFEIQTQLVVAGELKLGSEEDRIATEALSMEVGKMLVAIMKRI